MPNSTSLRTSAISFSFRGFRQSLDHKRGSASINEGNRYPQTVGCDRGNRCAAIHGHEGRCIVSDDDGKTGHYAGPPLLDRSEEHTSELQSLMRISYAVFCLKKKKKKRKNKINRKT